MVSLKYICDVCGSLYDEIEFAEECESMGSPLIVDVGTVFYVDDYDVDSTFHEYAIVISSTTPDWTNHRVRYNLVFFNTEDAEKISPKSPGSGGMYEYLDTFPKGVVRYRAKRHVSLKKIDEYEIDNICGKYPVFEKYLEKLESENEVSDVDEIEDDGDVLFDD